MASIHLPITWCTDHFLQPKLQLQQQCKAPERSAGTDSVHDAWSHISMAGCAQVELLPSAGEEDGK